MKKNVQKFFGELFMNNPVLVQCRNEIEEALSLLITAYENRQTVLVCGNGGSAADAEHIVGELMKGFRYKRAIPPADRERLTSRFGDAGEKIAAGLQSALPAISLVSQSGIITAFANDVDADLVFAQQIWGYGKNGDILIALSTSGNSKNVCNAVMTAKTCGMKVIGLTGRSGGKMAALCDVTIKAPADETYRIQEHHLPIYHALCAMVEEHFFGDISE